MPTVELIGGGTLSSGVLVKNTEGGLIHYGGVIGDILFVRTGSRQ